MRCTQATRVKGLDIPESMLIAVDVLSVHFDPSLRGPHDPQKFYPLRFSKESEANRNACAFLAFGVGPRFCLGMKMAMLEIKLALAKVLINFQVMECDTTP